MEDLDDYLLAKILGFIPRGDQLKLFRVSNRWYKVMDECVGIDVLIGRGTRPIGRKSLDSGQEPIDPFKLMNTVGVRSCTMNFFVNDSTVLPKLKYPNLLHFVYFKNFVSSKTFESVLHGVTNLHTLKIDCFVLHNLEFKDMTVSLPCQVLEIGTSGSIYAAYIVLNQSSFEIMSLNLTHLLRNSFTGLKIVKMLIPTVQELLETVTEEVVNFLYSHAESLTCLEIEMYPYWNYEHDNYELAVTHPKPLNVTKRPFDNLREILLEVDDDCEWRLKRLESFPDFWIPWASNAQNLEVVTLRFQYCEVLTLLKSIVQYNEATLTRIRIFSGKLTSFDCEILQNCNSLKFLKIQGAGYYDRLSAEENASAELHNAQLLPKTLVYLHIEDIPITNETCKLLCLDLPNLDVLYLISIGNIEDFGYGVPIDVAREMLQRKQIRGIMVDTGTGAGTHDNHIKNLLETSYKYNSPNSLVCYLLENGEYGRK